MKYYRFMNGRPKISYLDPLVMIFWASELWIWSTDFFNFHEWEGNTHYFHGFGLITHQILMIYEWEALNILSRSITYDLLGVLTMDMVY
jgi:hypothetical protein